MCGKNGSRQPRPIRSHLKGMFAIGIGCFWIAIALVAIGVEAAGLLALAGLVLVS